MTFKMNDKFNIEKKIKPRRRKSRWLLFTSVALIAFMAGLIGFVIPIASKFALLEVFLTLSPAQNFITETNVLILGIDNVEGTHRSDTIMIAHIDPANKEVKLVSVPRDTLTVIPGRGLDKINHAFAFGGMELSRVTISRFLGIDIPYYLTIDVSGLADIIDRLGGIEIDVEKRMYYVDYAGGLFVDLQPGLQRLNGRDAVAYVRFRHDSLGDTGRINRQQKFLRALASELTARSNLLKSPGLILSLLSDIQTNMNMKEVLGLAMASRQAYDLGHIEMASIPGRDIMIDKISYWKPDYDGTQAIVKKFFKSEKVNTAESGRLSETIKY